MQKLPVKESTLMTIKQVAEVLGVSTRYVNLKVKEFYPNLLQNGVTTFLNEKEITHIKLEMEKNPSLEQSFKVKTNLEKKLLIQQAMNFLNEEVEELRLYVSEIKTQNKELYIENNQLKPKAEFFDAVTESKDCIDMGNVAKLLNKKIGRNKLFQFLRDKKVLMRDNTPYQNYIDRSYFRVIESKFNKPDGTVHINLKTLVTQKGVNFLNKIIDNRKEVK